MIIIKKNKRKKIILLSCAIILVLSIIIVCVLIAIKSYHVEEISNISNSNERYITNVDDCLKIGNTCSNNNISDGLLTKIKLNNDSFSNFYVINDDEDTVTLIMDKNIIEISNWSKDNKNLNGPNKILSDLENISKKWTNINLYSFYNHDDNCNSNDKCTNAGYKNISIEDGKLVITNNDGQIGKIDNLRVRIPDIHELKNYENNIYVWLKNNLNDGEGFWLIDSDNDITKASALANIDNELKIISASVINESKYKIGIRPIIRIPKYFSQENDASDHDHDDSNFINSIGEGDSTAPNSEIIIGGGSK